ncbi:peptide-methionine (S)-S-oxide reductase [Pseudomonas sp. GB2N2]
MIDLRKKLSVEQTTFGVGCFWGVEASYRALPGLVGSRVGFASSSRDESEWIDVVKVDFDAR